ANRIREEVDPDANIIVGSTLDTGMEGMMRVSVVATGIDASVAEHDIPVPRRSLAEPLKPAGDVAEDVPAQDDVAARTESEPSLFQTNDLDAQRAAAEDQMEDIFEPAPDRFVAPQADDDYTPAYQPRQEAFDTNGHRAEDEYEEDLDGFVAPRAPAPGTPSPEALARLQHAVTNTPAQQGQPRPQAVENDQPHEDAAGSEQRPRFGINSLINRMTGHGAEAEAPRPARQQPTMQAQQPRQSAPEPQESTEDEQIEIPAFLRRQAN
ncbi:MAG: cell division protein FtsZ, partial [Roseovarius gahaiensis]